jgi:hypothetical protein
MFQDSDSSKSTITVYSLKSSYNEIVYASKFSYNSYVGDVTLAGDDNERKSHLVLNGLKKFANNSKTFKVEYLLSSYRNS